MKAVTIAVVAVLGMSSAAMADPWKDESGKGRWGGDYDRRYDRSFGYDRGGDYDRRYRAHDRDYKQEYYRGPCKIERKWGKHGEYKEETKCKGYD